MSKALGFVRLSAIVLCFCLGTPARVYATGLPAEHEAARLLLAVESAVNNQHWERAASQLEKLRQLEVSVPHEAHYYEGVVRIQLKQYEPAQRSLEQYVVQSGKEGRHYLAALKLITQAEEARASSQATAAGQESVMPELTKQSGEGYIRSLQALYLTDDPVQALVMQVNSLLAAHPYTGSRIKKSKAHEGVSYQIGISERDLVVQEKAYEKGQATLKVSKLSVLGIDPFVRTGCSTEEFACWLYDPVNEHQRWILIDRDDIVVKELGDAMSKLIIHLQK